MELLIAWQFVRVPAALLCKDHNMQEGCFMPQTERDLLKAHFSRDVPICSWKRSNKTNRKHFICASNLSANAGAGLQVGSKQLWRHFFLNPTEWWDHRLDKRNSRYPDFKHKRTEHALWIETQSTPKWVKAKLLVLGPETLQRSLLSWNIGIAKCVTNGENRKALEHFQEMQRRGVSPDKFTFVSVFKACTGLMLVEEGRQLHGRLIFSSFEPDIYVWNCIVDMYAKCGCIEDASSIFNNMQALDSVSWNAMMAGYVKCGHPEKALNLYGQMIKENLKPDCITFVALLKACTRLELLEEGRYIHAQLIKSGLSLDIYVVSCLVGMYAKCQSIEDACRVFNSTLSFHDVVTWNAMIVGYAKCGHSQHALVAYEQMQKEKVKPNRDTFFGVLNACAGIASLEYGRYVHLQAIQRKLDSDMKVRSCLVDMYTKCGSMEDAWKVFNKLSDRDVVLWSTMVIGYIRCGNSEKALSLFWKMQEGGIQPDNVTIVAVLNLCASKLLLEDGRHIHAQIVGSHFALDAIIGNSLLNMYVNCGNVHDAYIIFSNMLNRDLVTWNSMIVAYIKNGEGEKALVLLQQLQQIKTQPSGETYVAVLNACASVCALEIGRRVHAQVVCTDFECNLLIGICMVDMYAKCGSLEDTCRVFNNLEMRNVESWNTMLVGYCKCGRSDMALELFQQMQRERIEPNSMSYVSALSACAVAGALEEGRRIHEQVSQSPLETDTFVASSLINMYTKCKSMEEAAVVFGNIKAPDAICWGMMIAGYLGCRQGEKSLKVFEEMQVERVEPDRDVFLSVLSACASLGEVEEGRKVHEQVIRNNLESDVFVQCGLVDMYAKCESVEDACRVFSYIPLDNVTSCNAMIMGYAKCGLGQKALALFHLLLKAGVHPNNMTFVSVLNGCTSLAALDEGRNIHNLIIDYGLESDLFVGSCLINMFVKCRSLEDACRVFKNMPSHNVVCWSTLISGHVKCGEGQKALELFQQMQQEGLEPDLLTYVCVLNACASVSALEEGRVVHALLVQNGLDSDIVVCNALIDMYSKCESIADSCKIFNNMHARDIVSWNAMLVAYVRYGQGFKALDLFQQLQLDGLQPDRLTFLAVLNACAVMTALEKGRHMHAKLMRSGFESDIVIRSCLIDMYCKCGRLRDACRVFNTMAAHDVVSWNSIIMAHVRGGEGEKALELFQQMQNEHVEPNKVTFIGILNACAETGILEEGRQVHLQVAQRGLDVDAFVASCLIDMYGKCGSIEDACEVFKKMPVRDVVSWNTMIAGYGKHGLSREAFQLFDQMCQEGVLIDGGTFVCLLSSFSHRGMTDEGYYFLDSMIPVYGVLDRVEHYSCVIDILGRAGCLKEAEDFIDTMWCLPDTSVWMALLGACRIHGNVQLGELAAKRLLELDPENSSGYVLLSNIYAAAGAWKYSAKIQQMRKKRHVLKKPGRTWIEVKS